LPLTRFLVLQAFCAHSRIGKAPLLSSRKVLRDSEKAKVFCDASLADNLRGIKWKNLSATLS
jgi:hypothetical protein